MAEDPFVQAAFGRINETAMLDVATRPNDPQPPSGSKPHSRLLSYQQLIDETFELTASKESL
jgi:hypothetical protein